MFVRAAATGRRHYFIRIEKSCSSLESPRVTATTYEPAGYSKTLLHSGCVNPYKSTSPSGYTKHESRSEFVSSIVIVFFAESEKRYQSAVSSISRIESYGVASSSFAWLNPSLLSPVTSLVFIV
jgi:hypothetical protein